MATFLGALLMTSVIAGPVEDNAALTATGNTRFGQRMYQAVSRGDDNIIFSPFSIHACLSMLYQGSSGDIHTALQGALGVSHTTAAEGYSQIMRSIQPKEETKPEPWEPNSDPVTIAVANKIYLNQTFELKEEFQETVTNKFYSVVEKVNFYQKEEAVAKINAWVGEQTKQRIKDLLKADDVEKAALVLINAIYFKGAWVNPFEEVDTKDGSFHLDAENTVQVPLMEQTEDFYYKEDADLDARVLEMPYYTRDYNNEFSMVVVLPNKRDGIHELEQKMANVDINELLTGGDSAEVHVKLPKFKIEQTIDLKESFEKLGLESLFEPSYDLSGLIKTPWQLYVSKAIHKAFIEVNEKGTEAAAATAIVVATPDADIIPDRIVVKTFHVDHPFLFFLTHNAYGTSYKNTLFYGKVQRPEYK